eukprot:GHVT01022194.1.p1 GENE.GHVT01022194.1~~GHVT01022194.1.p1  ORF type:complete len:313 (-),score=63.92 GHVT01022194.1:2166-3047(-)
MNELRQWDQLVELQRSQATLNAHVGRPGKDGVHVTCNGVHGFLPMNQVAPCWRQRLLDRAETAPVNEAKGELIIPVKVLDVDLQAGWMLVSNKRVEAQRQMERMSVGAPVGGTVVAVKNFGAIVEFGNCTGLLHISQVSGRRVPDIGGLLPVGMPIVAVVTDYDKATGRVALSTRALETTPGDMLRNATAVFATASSTARRLADHRQRELQERDEAARQLLRSLGVDYSVLQQNNTTADGAKQPDDQRGVKAGGRSSERVVGPHVPLLLEELRRAKEISHGDEPGRSPTAPSH